MSIVLSTFIGLFMRTIQFLISFLSVLFFVVWLHTRDLFYTAANFFRPSRDPRSVVPPGHPGHRGIWPDYIAPVQGRDSRSPCPGLNALANHNILPHNGKHITYKQISHAVQHAYNLSPTLAQQLTAAAVQLDQGRGWINLHDLNALNVIQHDASFTRPDIAFCPDQSVPDLSLVKSFMSYSSNGKTLSIKDLATYSGDRRAACKQSNGQYSLTYSFSHKFFGSGNAALIFAIFGGEVEDLRTWLSEERLPYGWQPKNREAFGHTIAQAQLATLAIEFNINEKQKL